MLLDNSSRSNDDEEELYTIIEVSIIMAHECIYSDSDTSGSTKNWVVLITLLIQIISNSITPKVYFTNHCLGCHLNN